MESQPWHWQPSADAWFAELLERAGRWRPSEELRVDADPFRALLARAVRQRADWLWHPCVSRLTAAERGEPWKRDLQLLIWIGLNGGVGDAEVTLPGPAAVWTPAGTREMRAGTHRLHRFTEDACQCPGEPAVDLCCESIGYAEEHSWAAYPPTSTADTQRLTAEVDRYLRCVAFLTSELPACRTWVSHVTKVAVPLRGEGEAFRSCSHPEVPAAVFLDLRVEHQVLEALVHESAHLYLFRTEASGPLVDPDYLGRHHSPLRPEPRPLRGILLAYHALAFIAAFYRDTLDLPRVRHWGTRELDGIRRGALDAEAVLSSCTRHLTPAGRDFFEMTRHVLEYSDQ